MISISDMIDYGITLQGPVTVVVPDEDAYDNKELFQGDAQDLSSMSDEDWMERDIAYIYPDKHHSLGFCIELKTE